MKLTARLAAAASLIPKGSVIADIGTDHAYIPVFVCENDICPHAIAADIGKGPLQAAISHVRGSGLTDKIYCRLGDGLTCLQPGEADGAVLCGMGGPLMVKILSQSYALWQSLSFAILQPQSEAGTLRRYLYAEGWHIEAEKLVIDGHRFYEMMRAVPGKADPLPDWLYEIGPLNWQRRDPLLQRKIALLLDKKEHILQGLQKSHAPVQDQQEKLQKEIHFWRDLLCQLL